jgi:hypothetical protein
LLLFRFVLATRHPVRAASRPELSRSITEIGSLTWSRRRNHNQTGSYYTLGRGGVKLTEESPAKVG